MDIMELGAIGELVGGIAVIASLVYVGFQLRQSTHAQNAATIESHLHTLITMNNLIAGDSDLARIMSEGVVDRSSLDRAEYFRFHLTLRGVFLAFDAFRVKREDGMVNDSLWFSNQSILSGMMRMPGVDRWWARNLHEFSLAFRAFIESQSKTRAEPSGLVAESS